MPQHVWSRWTGEILISPTKKHLPGGGGTAEPHLPAGREVTKRLPADAVLLPAADIVDQVLNFGQPDHYIAARLTP